MKVPCVHCSGKAYVPKAFAEKHRIDAFLCDDCAKKAQEQFKGMTDEQISKLADDYFNMPKRIRGLKYKQRGRLK